MPILGTVASSIRVTTGSYYSIAYTSLSSTASSVSFTSISSEYTFLRAIVIARSTHNASLIQNEIRFNGDTAQNYIISGIYSSGGTVATYFYTNQTNISGFEVTGSTFDSGYPGHNFIDIHGYSNTSVLTTVQGASGFQAVGNGTTYGTRMPNGVWRSTATVTSIEFKPSAGNWATNSTFALYGIK